jgi:putative redox protein
MTIMARVTAASLDGWKMQMSDGRHSWVADVGAKSGGADAGPGPFDHLLAALAACACFITRRYAQTAGIPVQAVAVEAEGDWVKDPSGQELYQIRLSARYGGDLSEADLKRLERAANTCPVKQAFGGLIRIETTVGRLPSP